MSKATARIGGPAMLVAMCLLCQSAVASLGLGEARVQSYLGQNLDVRIALVQSGDAGLDSLEVAVASSEDHARLGVSSEALALGLSATLDLGAEPPVIRLRSSRPVSDPFVQVLINARWASGRMLREYTLFLDPPAVPVAPPVRTSEDRRPTPSAPASQPEPAAPSTADSEPPPEPDEQVTPQPPAVSPAQAEPDEAAPSALMVERGDTLWSIAADWRPDAGLTMNQAMLAIFDRNPEAFIGNNVNRLRRGARLTLPEADEARSIPAAEAARRFREQVEAWEAGRTAPVVEPAEPVEAESSQDVAEPESPEPEPAEPAEPEVGEARTEEPEPAEPEVAGTGTEEAADAAVDSDPQPRLELAPPDEDLVAEAAAIDVERQRLSEQLAELESEMALDGLQSAQTDALVDQIRQAIDSADAGGLMVASEDLATLEERLREARQAREAEQRAAAQAAEPPEEAAAPARPEAAPKGFLERWMWPLIGAGIGLILLVVLIALWRRRAERHDEERALGEQQDARAQADSGPAFSAALPVETEAAPSADESDRREDDAGADSDADAQAAALMGILSREDDEDEQADTRSPISGTDERRDGLGDEDDEAPDLARLSDRLDPQEQAESPSSPSDSAAPVLEDEDIEELFAADDPTTAWTDARAEADSGPLTLDFDLPEGEPGPEEDPAGEDRREAAERPDDSDPDEFDSAIEGAQPPPEPEESDWFALEDTDQEPGPADHASPEEAGAADAVEPSESPEASTTLGDEDAEVKLDLARAYISMEDPDSARTLIDEILSDGSPTHQEQARKLLDSLK